MPDIYATLLATYRERVRTLVDTLTDHLRAQGLTPDAVTSALDRLIEQSTDTSATLWTLLEDVPHVADALRLSHLVLAWLALKMAAAHTLGVWTLHEPPAMPTEAALAALLEQVWELEGGRGRGAP